MKKLINLFLPLIIASALFAEEGKQENILKIEKFEQKNIVIQSPVEKEHLEPEPKREIKKEQKIVLPKPKVKPVKERIEQKIVESIELANAWKLYDSKNFKEAIEKFQSLIESTNQDIALSAREGLAYSLKNLNLLKGSLEHFEYLYSKDYKVQDMAIEIVDILIKIEDFEGAEKYAFKYCISPHLFFDHAKKLKDLGEREKAKEMLLKVFQCSQDNRELRAGVLFELSSIIDSKSLLDLIAEERKTQTDRDYLSKIGQLEIDIYRKKIASLDIKSMEVRELATKILSINPSDKDAKTTLAWHYFNLKNYDRALELFTELNKDYPQEEEYLLGKAYVYNALEKDDQLIETIEKSNIRSDKLNQLRVQAYIRKADRNKADREYKQAFENIKKLAMSNDSLSNQRAAQWFCDYGFPILASHVDSSNIGACYYREQFPQLEASFEYRYKSGDEGYSKLKEFKIPLTFHYPIREGQKLSLRVLNRYVSAGSLSENPYLGNFYRYLNGDPQINKPITSKWLIEPEIFYEIEGYPHVLLSLGTTPINATVSPMPTFSLNFDFKDFWIRLRQNSVQDSLLSIQGQKDPYSSSKWGRVLRTGIEGGYNFIFPNSYWLTLSGEFDYLWGENLWSNYSFGANVTVGKTIKLSDNSQLDLGIFYVLKHFQRNSNFFTFGHGGYFSPQFFHMIGPTLRFQTKECCRVGIDLRASLGYLYYKTDDAPHYPKFNYDESLLNLAALNDARGSYEGEKKSKLGGSIEAKIRRSISKNFTIYGYGAINTSSNFNEWNLGAGLIYYFVP